MTSLGFLNMVLMGALVTGSVICQSLVVSATSSDWIDIPEPDTKACINLTYTIPGANKQHSEKSELGKYGSGKIGSAYGLVIHIRSKNRTDEHDGCHYPFDNHIPNDTAWIALIKRGGCTFEKKLENAWRSKASAMVVYDDKDNVRDELDRMGMGSGIGKPNGHSYAIPGILTYKWKGEEIASLVDNGTNVTMYITVADSRLAYNGINRTSVLFVSISFIVLMIISLAWLVFYYVQRFRYLHAKDRLAQRLCNAAKKALAKIPTRSIKLNDKEMTGEGECCAVCIEVYRSGDMLRTLPCRHEFHKICVDPWLLEHRTCPMCKMDILKYYGFIFTGSQESILHLDMDENVMNSSESRDSDSPTHESHHRFHGGEEHPQTSVATAFTSSSHNESIRKPSLISLTVVQGESIASNGCCNDGDMERRRASSRCSVETPTHLHEHPMCLALNPSGLPESQCQSSLSQSSDHIDQSLNNSNKGPDSVVVHKIPAKDYDETMNGDKSESRRSSLIQCVISSDTNTAQQPSPQDLEATKME